MIPTGPRRGRVLGWPVQEQLSIPGERTVGGQEWEEKDPDSKEQGRKGVKENTKSVQRKSTRRTQSMDIWPRRTRTDITDLYH